MRLPAQLLQRKRKAHKGDFGHVLILAGCLRFSGASILCANSAMRAGAGLVTLGLPEGLAQSIIKRKPPEVMLKPLAQTSRLTLSLKAYPQIKAILKTVDILIIGPGLSQDKSTQHLIQRLIRVIDKPVVIDADGLNALCGHLGVLVKNKNRPQFVLTPHPGEMARLLGVTTKNIQADRKQIAKSFAKAYAVTVVLKGFQTIIADYRCKLYINKTGNPGMAAAGSGDVLAGIIGAFLAQGLDSFAAAKYAVYLHGLAGDLAAKQKTELAMIASDIIDNIPRAIKLSS
ncbi:MAG: NAD(P)H-hydrate dehydratase [Candidatus Omnitrophota bacterium]